MMYSSWNPHLRARAFFATPKKSFAILAEFPHSARSAPLGSKNSEGYLSLLIYTISLVPILSAPRSSPPPSSRPPPPPARPLPPRPPAPPLLPSLLYFAGVGSKKEWATGLGKKLKTVP